MKTGERLLMVATLCWLAGSPLPSCRAADAVHPSAKIMAQFHLPPPPYPYMARVNYEQGFGTVHVVCGESGKVVEAVMRRSTGHEDLDENTVRYAREHWRGPANVAITVPVTYVMSGARLKPYKLRPDTPNGWYTPLPPYPAEAIRFMEHGSGVMKVTTDEHGKAIHAEMIKSTGGRRLDNATIEYALDCWSGPPKSSKEVPVNYVMRLPHHG